MLGATMNMLLSSARARQQHVHRGPQHGNRSEEHTSELQSLRHLVCRLLLEKKNKSRHEIALRETTTSSLLVKSCSFFSRLLRFSMFFCHVPSTPEIYTLSLHDALPIFDGRRLLGEEVVRSHVGGHDEHVVVERARPTTTCSSWPPTWEQIGRAHV